MNLDWIQLGNKRWLRTQRHEYVAVKYTAAVWVRVHMHASTLPRALKSIEEQEGFKNLEVNIIVHGCTDNSEQIASDFQTRNPHNTSMYIAPKDDICDVGQSFRTLLLNHNTSDWHFFLPGDDYWLAGKLVAHEIFVSNFPNADFYCHRTYKDLSWSIEDEPTSRMIKITDKNQRFVTTGNVRRITAKDYAQTMKRNDVGIESSCYHKKLVDALNSDLINHPQGDLVFDILCLAEAESMYFLDHLFTVYEVGQHSTGWNVLLRNDAEFDENVTSKNITLLTNAMVDYGDKEYLVLWATRMRSKLLAEMTWRRKLPRQFGDKTLNPFFMILFKDYPRTILGGTIRTFKLVNLSILILNTWRDLLRK